MDSSQRRQRLLGIIVRVWGGTLVIRALVAGIPAPGKSPYASGAFAAWVLGFVMVIVGRRTIVKSRRPADS